MANSRTQQHWYAVHTRANFEQTVTNDLDARGIEAYCPVFEEISKRVDRRKLINRPVFPGYVFTRIADNPDLRLRVLKSKGAVRILGIGSAIEPVPDQDVESVRRMLASGKPCFQYPFLREGALVRVRRGPLRNLSGILVRIKNRTRLVVSVNLLQQAVAADIDVSDVEVLSSARAEPAKVSMLV